MLLKLLETTYQQSVDGLIDQKKPRAEESKRLIDSAPDHDVRDDSAREVHFGLTVLASDLCVLLDGRSNFCC